MCGISGYFGKESSEPSKKHVHHTLKKMENRGKDGFGFDKVNLDNNKKLLFLHTRLSIIDPEIRSNQPLKEKIDCRIPKCTERKRTTYRSRSESSNRRMNKGIN